MKTLFLNPIASCLIAAISVVYILILLYLLSKRKLTESISSIEHCFNFVFLTLIIVSSSVSYIGNFSLAFLAGYAQNKNLAFIYTVHLLTYTSILILLRSKFGYFVMAIKYLSKDFFLTGLLFLFLISAFWSETPLHTFKASLVLLGLSLYAAFVAARSNFHELVRYLRLFGMWVAISSILIQVLMPSLVVNSKDPNAWQGITGHPNMLGQLMSMNVVLWTLNAINNPKWRWQSVACATVSLIVMLLSKSAGSIVSLTVLLGLILLPWILSHLRFRYAFTTLIFLVISAIPLSILFYFSKTEILALLGRESNLTGRTDFWPDLINSIQQKPLLGYGYRGFWQSWRGADNPAAHIATQNIIPDHAHNGFLDLALAVGLIGAFLFLFSVIRNFSQIVLLFEYGNQVEATIALVILPFVIICNLSESLLFDINIFLCLYIYLSTRLNIDVHLLKSANDKNRSLSSYRHSIYRHSIDVWKV